MATLKENKNYWDGKYDWQERGDDWSRAWGGPHMQWYGTIYPRIKAHLPTKRILEIACGFGRWTHFLKDNCKQLLALDLSEECINACSERFSDSQHIEYILNDGMSLELIESNTVDFIFSFDSLVHVDESVIRAYLEQFQRILTNDGIAFIHHSNLGEYRQELKKVESEEGQLHWRDPSVDAVLVETIANQNGLKCLSQELVYWGTNSTFIDCFSTISKNISGDNRENKVLRNTELMNEARNLRQLSQLYSL